MELIWGTVLVAFARVRAALSLTDIDRDGGFTAVVMRHLLSAPGIRAGVRGEITDGTDTAEISRTHYRFTVAVGPVMV
jgi:hypothetical protein